VPIADADGSRETAKGSTGTWLMRSGIQTAALGVGGCGASGDDPVQRQVSKEDSSGYLVAQRTPFALVTHTVTS